MIALDSMRGLSLTILRHWSLTWTLAMLALVATPEGDMPRPSRCSPCLQVLLNSCKQMHLQALAVCPAPSPTP